MQFDALKAAVSGWSVAHIDLIKAAVLGIVEGLTEYLPVSSTGICCCWSTCSVGATTHSASRLPCLSNSAPFLRCCRSISADCGLSPRTCSPWPAARFVIGVLLAFLPAAVLGALAYHYIKSYLFDVRVVCVSLIVGGFVLMWVDRLNLQARYHEATGFRF